MMMTGNINVLFTHHPQTSPNLYNTDKSDQMNQVAERRVKPSWTSFEKTLNKWNLNKAKKKIQRITDGKGDEHGDGLVLGINIQIREIV